MIIIFEATFLLIVLENGLHVVANKTVWTPWSSCSATCGEGVRVRSQRCPDDKPKCKLLEEYRIQRCEAAVKSCETVNDRGSLTSKLSLKTQKIHNGTKTVPIIKGHEFGHTARWSHWTQWSECDCGFRKKLRFRICAHDASTPIYIPCEGARTEEKVCEITEGCVNSLSVYEAPTLEALGIRVKENGTHEKHMKLMSTNSGGVADGTLKIPSSKVKHNKNVETSHDKESVLNRAKATIDTKRNKNHKFETDEKSTYTDTNIVLSEKFNESESKEKINETEKVWKSSKIITDDQLIISSGKGHTSMGMEKNIDEFLEKPSDQESKEIIHDLGRRISKLTTDSDAKIVSGNSDIATKEVKEETTHDLMDGGRPVLLEAIPNEDVDSTLEVKQVETFNSDPTEQETIEDQINEIVKESRNQLQNDGDDTDPVSSHREATDFTSAAASTAPVTTSTIVNDSAIGTQVSSDTIEVTPVQKTSNQVSCKGSYCHNSVLRDNVAAYLKKIEEEEENEKKHRVKRGVLFAKLRQLRQLSDFELAEQEHKKKHPGEKTDKDLTEPVWDERYEPNIAHIKISDSSKSSNAFDVPVALLDIPAVKLEMGFDADDKDKGGGKSSNTHTRDKRGLSYKDMIASEPTDTANNNFFDTPLEVIQIPTRQAAPELNWAIQKGNKPVQWREKREDENKKDNKTEEHDEACVGSCWSQWSEWTECSSSCGTGHKIRSRHCKKNTDRRKRDDYNNQKTETEHKIQSMKGKNPRVVHKDDCKGDDHKVTACTTEVNDPDCKNWDKIKGSGIQWGGEGSAIDMTENEIADEKIDAILKILADSTLSERQTAKKINDTNMEAARGCELSVWSQWSSCSTSCGQGVKYRKKACRTKKGEKCVHCFGDNEETLVCNQNTEDACGHKATVRKSRSVDDILTYSAGNPLFIPTVGIASGLLATGVFAITVACIRRYRSSSRVPVTPPPTLRY